MKNKIREKVIRRQFKGQNKSERKSYAIEAKLQVPEKKQRHRESRRKKEKHTHTQVTKQNQKQRNHKVQEQEKIRE